MDIRIYFCCSILKLRNEWSLLQYTTNFNRILVCALYFKRFLLVYSEKNCLFIQIFTIYTSFGSPLQLNLLFVSKLEPKGRTKTWKLAIITPITWRLLSHRFTLQSQWIVIWINNRVVAHFYYNCITLRLRFTPMNWHLIFSVTFFETTLYK